MPADRPSIPRYGLTPCWRPCPNCSDYWCDYHRRHAHECGCPSIEEWVARGVYPYVEDRTFRDE